MSSTTSQGTPADKPTATRMAAQGTAGPGARALKLVLILVAATAVLSLLYAIQYYLGGPLRIPVTTPINSLALVPGGTIMAAGRQDGQIQVWDAGQNWSARRLKGHDGPVTGLAFIPQSYTLISVGRDGTVRQWNAIDSNPGQVLADTGVPLNDLSLTADGSTLATIGGDGHVRIWDLRQQGQMLRDIDAGGAATSVVALSPDGRLVAAGDGPNVQLWDAQTGATVKRFEGRWDDPETEATWLGHRRPVTALAFSPDGTLLASGGADATFVFWTVDEGAPEWLSEGHYGVVSDIVFHPDPKANLVLTASRDTKVRSWGLPGGKIRATYEGHLSAATSVAFGTDSNMILSAGDDGTVRAWNATNQRVTHVEWTQFGILPVWGRLLSLWFVISGVVGLVAFWGLRRGFIWSHLLTLALFLLGPIVVLGLPLFEVTRYPTSNLIRLQVAVPLVLLAAWYIAILILLTRESVAMRFEAPDSLTLADRLMTSRRTAQARLGLYGSAVWILVLVLLYSVLRRFNLDVSFMGHFFSFIMTGAGITLYVSALSILLAVLLAMLGALGRLSTNPIANGISSFYISLIRGTPLLVQVFIWYLGIPRVGIVLPAIVSGVLALGVNYGAYMTETFRAGIQAIGKGQHEAAHALGMTGGQTFRRIVLPQAFRIVIPPIGNDFIAMMKDSSLVSVITVWELTFRAQKIGRQYFRALETFLIAAAFYWLLTVVFQFLQGKLETYLARSERR